MIKRIGLKSTFKVMYFVTILSMSGVLYIQMTMSDREGRFIMPPLLLLSGFGVTVIFMSCYITTFTIFSVKDRGSAMKWCNIVSRSLTIFAPFIAEMEHPWALVIMISFLIFSIIAVNFLKI